MSEVSSMTARKEIIITPGQEADTTSLSLLQEEIHRDRKYLHQVTFDFCCKTELAPQEMEWLQQLRHQCLQENINFSLIQVSPKLLKSLVKFSVDFIDAVHPN